MLTILSINEFEKTVEHLKDCFIHQVNINDKLREENKNLKDEHYKDAAMADMKQQLEQIRADSSRGFSISEAEANAVSEWRSRHLKEHHNGKTMGGAIGGGFEYSFIPTSIGVFGTCYCSSCKVKAEDKYIHWMIKENKKPIHTEIYIDKKREFMNEYDCYIDFQEEAQ